MLRDPRLSDLIHSHPEQADVVIIGIPTDEGIARNGGRIGAAQAPATIRESLQKLTPYAGPQFKQQLNDIRIADIGDIASGDLETMHDRASAAISELIAAGKIVIALGGGHDVTYPLVKGFRTGLGRLQSAPTLAVMEFGLVNIDAHLDVREKKNGQHHSGSSFRLLIEEGIVSSRRF